MSQKQEKKNKRFFQNWTLLSPIKIGILIVLLSLLSLVHHYRKPLDAPSDIVALIERKILDMRFVIRGPIQTNGDVGILTVDEESISEFGRWPFERKIYLQAFENLKRVGVLWIGLDSVFSEPERPYLDDAAEGIQQALEQSFQGRRFDIDRFNESLGMMLDESPGDKKFAKGLKAFENVVQGYFYNTSPQDGFFRPWPEYYNNITGNVIDFIKFPKNKSLTDYPNLIAWGVVSNVPSLAAATPYHGFFNNESDPDGIIRWGTLIRSILPLDEKGEVADEPQLFPSMSLLLAAQYLGRVPVVRFNQNGVETIDLMDPDGVAPPMHIPISMMGDGRFLLNHYGPGGSFPYISLKDAVLNKLPKKLPKFLLFGATATGINDIRASPMDKMVPGVEHHAAILENILTENYLKRPPYLRYFELLLLMVSGLFFTLLLNRASALNSAIVFVLFSVFYYLIDRIFVFNKGYWMYMGLPFLQNLGIYMGITLFKYFTEEKEKKKVKNAFQHYLNPAVINQIMDNPDKLKLGGQKKELTVFFSDVRGFTTISETLSPEALSNFLNEYFTPMTKIILESDGLLDKYMGDAIMAVWGAPIDLPDHADRALVASLRMLDALDYLQNQWKKRGLPMIDIGIGLNTGLMSVGNMGSDIRFDYTVMGDAVNLGSRLESINKQYGTRIICSEYTKKALKNPKRFVLRELDDIQVKGKTEPVKIFEVVRFNNQNRSVMEKLVANFEQGIALYKAQKWDEAIAQFVVCLGVVPGDEASEEYVRRCQYFKEESPGENWNGVWVMKTK